MIPIFKPRPLDCKILEDILANGKLTNFGDKSKHLENNISQMLKRPVAVVSSGTAALVLALKGLSYLGKIPQKARIGVPSFTFFASSHAIKLANMIPVFLDVNEQTFVLEHNREDVDAFMPVNVFGVQPDMTLFNKPIIGDLSHGFGGSKNGILNGQLGDVACFSTSITKPFHTIEGGIIAGDYELIEWVKLARQWGNNGDYNPAFIGDWAKQTEINCAIGLNNIIHLDSEVKHRNNIALLYKKYLDSSRIDFQIVPNDTVSTYKDFAILLKDRETRDAVAQALSEKEIQTRKYFYPACHNIKAYKDDDKYVLPNTENIADRVLCLPIHYAISENEVMLISSIINRSI